MGKPFRRDRVEFPDKNCTHASVDYRMEDKSKSGRGAETAVIGLEEIMAALHAIGLQPGDHVVAHASLSSIGHVRGGAQAVVDALLGVLGPRGTLVMPYFFPLYDGVFDGARPPVTYTGAIPCQLREQSGALLSLHPSHPFVAVGAAAAQITHDHYRASGVGRDSPVDRLAKLGGKVLLLGVDQTANTTIHAGEAYAGVQYWGRSRPDRPSGRWVISPTRELTWLRLPDTPGDSTGFPRIEPMLIERQLIRFGQVGEATCRLMPAQALIEAVVEYLRLDPAGLLCERPGCPFCTWARGLLFRR
jgi:aminoglycoside 3-N-acetyltransferase